VAQAVSGLVNAVKNSGVVNSVRNSGVVSTVAKGVKSGGVLGLASLAADPILGAVAGEGSKVQRLV
jgi:hypothetical protein